METLNHFVDYMKSLDWNTIMMLLLIFAIPIWYIFEYFSRDTSHVILYIGDEEVFAGTHTDMVAYIRRNGWGWSHYGHKVLRYNDNLRCYDEDNPIGYYIYTG